MKTRPARLLARALVGALVAIAALALALGGIAGPSFAAAAPFSVRVFDQNGNPLSGLSVVFGHIDGPHGGFWGVSSGSESAVQKGTYVSVVALTDLDTYTVQFDMPVSPTAGGAWSTVYLGNVTDVLHAETFEPGPSLRNLDATLTANTNVNVSVTSPAGVAVPYASVSAFRAEGTEWVKQQLGPRQTDKYGRFSFLNVAAGRYKFLAEKPGSFVPTYSGSSASLAGAAVTEIGFGTSTLGVTVKMNTGGSITGALLELQYGTWWHDSSATPVAFPLVGEPGSWTDIDRARPFPGLPDIGEKWIVAGLPVGYYAVYFEGDPHSQTDDYGFVQKRTLELVAPWDGSTVAVFHVVGNETLVAPDARLPEWIPNSRVTDFSITVNSTDGGVLSVAAVFQKDDVAWSFVRFGSSPIYAPGSAKTLVNSGNPITPGHYKITVFDSAGKHFPVTFEQDLNVGYAGGRSVWMTEVPEQNFTVSPTLDSTDTAVGTTHTVTAVASQGAVLTYQWMRDGVAIYGATAASYTSRGADVGKVLSVRVLATVMFGSVTARDLTPIEGYAFVGVVTTGLQIANLSPPEIRYAGTGAYAGTVLHASPGEWSAPGVQTSFEWRRDGQLIGNESTTYVVTLQDVLDGAGFSVVGTAFKDGYPQSAPATSATVSASLLPAPTPKSPFLISTTTSGVPVGSVKYVVAPGLWSASPLSFSYRWLVGDEEVSSGSATYVSDMQEGLAALKVEVTATSPAYHPAVVTQVVRQGGAAIVASANASIFDLTSATVIDDGADPVDVGDTLEISSPAEWAAGGLVVEPTSVSYQWYRAWAGRDRLSAPIAGATSSLYTVLPNDAGMGLSVKVTARSADWPGLGTALSPAGRVAIGSSSATIIGVGAAGLPLSVVWAGDAFIGAPIYQWYQCLGVCPDNDNRAAFSAIPNASGASYTPTIAQQGSQVYASVRGRTASTIEMARSAIVTIAAADVIPVLKPPTFSVAADGTARVGVQTTLTAAAFGVGSLQHAFAWEVCAGGSDCSDDSSWTSVANASNFTPRGLDFGSGTNLLRVRDTASRAGYLSATSVSAAHTIVAGLLPTIATPIRTFSSPTVCHLSAVAATVEGTPVQPSIQWFSGVSLVGSGVDHSQPDQLPDEPVYAIATYSYPGFTDKTFAVACVKGAAVTDVVDGLGIVGEGYGSSYHLSVANPFLMPDALRGSAKISYYWYGDAGTTTQSSWTPALTDIGYDVDFDVVLESPFYRLPSVLETATGVIPAGEFHALSDAVSTSSVGSLVEGATITVAPTTYSLGSLSYRYVWEVSNDGDTWTPLGSTASKAFVVPHAAAGKSIRVTVVASRDGYVDVRLTSSPITIVPTGALSSFSSPVLSAAKVGVPATVNPGAWTAGVTFSYQWIRNGVQVPGAIGATFTPDGTAAGDALSAVVTAHRLGYVDLSVATNEVTVASGDAPVVTLVPVKSVVGSTLSITPGVWTVAGLTVTYQWLDGAVPIDGATGRSYVLGSGQVAANVHVTVSVHAIGYVSSSVTVS